MYFHGDVQHYQRWHLLSDVSSSAALQIGGSIICSKRLAFPLKKCYRSGMDSDKPSSDTHDHCQAINQTLNHTNTCTFLSSMEQRAGSKFGCILSILLAWHYHHSTTLDITWSSLFILCFFQSRVWDYIDSTESTTVNPLVNTNTKGDPCYRQRHPKTRLFSKNF